MTEAAEGQFTPEEAKIDYEKVCRQYRKISRNRPPFAYDPRTPKYPELDETRLFAMEARVFDAPHFPELPPELAHLHNFWAQLQLAHRELMQGIDDIKGFDAYHVQSTEITGEREANRRNLSKAASIEAAMDPLNDPHSYFRLEQVLWEKHYKEKKKYFQRALAYLELLAAYHPKPNSPEAAQTRRIQQETLSMFIGHQGTTHSRSASHELGPLRRNQEPTIVHPYEVCLDEINFWLDLIEKASDEQEIARLFQEMNFGILRGLFHDTLEDYYITPEDLANKLIEMINQDLRISTLMRQADAKERRLPPNGNFASINKELILAELLALKEPEKGPQMEGNSGDLSEYYLHKQIGDLPTFSKIRTYLTKVRDRKNNMKSPKYKKAGKEIIKMRENVEIIELGISVYLDALPHMSTRTEYGETIPEIMKLIDICIERFTAIEESETDQEAMRKDSNLQLIFEFSKKNILGIRERLQKLKKAA